MTSEELTVREFLIELAKTKEKDFTIPYQILSDNCNLGYKMKLTAQRNKLAKILVSIAELEESEGNPMLTSLVKSKYSKIPGKGFFELAHKFEKFSYTEDKKKKREFFEKELQAVYDFWKQS